VNSRPESNNASNSLFAARTMDRETLGEEAFHRMISIERRRTARSRKSFLLMLLDMGEHSTSKSNKLSLQKILSTLSRMLRETDVAGWYKEDSVVGVMFTEIALEDQNSIPATMMTRVSQALKSHLTPQQFHQIGISFHLLPETRERGVASEDALPAVFPGVAVPNGATETSL
jgi:hypothetical protein